MTKRVPLYKVPRESYIRVQVDEQTVVTLFFHHLDGMYSLCQDREGNNVHLAGWTEVEVVSDHAESG